MKEIKKALLAICHQAIDERISSFQQAIEIAKSAAKEDTKSSMGDKYETTRAMMQIEIEKNAKQLEEALKTKDLLHQLKIANTQQVQLGSIVKTNTATYFVAASMGKISYQNEFYYAVSLASPIGQKLLNLQKGDSFELNNKRFLVEAVW